MREFELKDNITISLTSIQWVEDEKSETELITKAFYEKKGNKNIISYEDTEATGFDGSVTIIEAEESKMASITRKGTANSVINLEMGKKHFCQYETPFGALQIGVYTKAIDNSLDTDGKLYLKYALDMNSVFVSDNEIILKIQNYN